ncbi:MAG: PHP domain-containing protein [Lachnospiraceae bacterium]|nr:PHP domain-containing protein [Lachnospiraceae bacterium]
MTHKVPVFLRMSELCETNSRIDMHMHTKWTDGKNSIGEMIYQAEKNRLDAIAITDHIRKTSDYYYDYLDAVRQADKHSKINIYCGFEAKVMGLDGELDIPIEAMQKADFIIGSVHRIPYENDYHFPKDFSYKELARMEKELSIAAINGSIDVLGHCGGMSLSTYKEFPEEYFEEIIEACSKTGVVFEYNYKYHYKYEQLIKRLLYKFDPYVSAGSDAHEIDNISNRSFV